VSIRAAISSTHTHTHTQNNNNNNNNKTLIATFPDYDCLGGLILELQT